jgi:hypothetical protein
VDVTVGLPTVWASVADAATGRPIVKSVRLAPDGAADTTSKTGVAGAVRGLVPALPPGAYRITVSVREVRGAGDLESSEVVAVFDDADLG